MLPDRLSSTSSNLDPASFQINSDVGASSSTPPQEAKWGMSAEMMQHMGSIRHGLDVFDLRVFLVWLGLHHMEKLPLAGIASSSASSPAYSKEQLTELIAKHVWELNFRVVSDALVDFITALQSIWDPSLPESFGILLKLIKSHVESSPSRCILLTEADQDVWKERPLREFGASSIEAPIVELERYGTLMPFLVEQLHSSLNNQAIEVEREQKLRTQMQEAAVELIESLPEEHRINAQGMYGWVCKEMAKHVEEYHAVDLGFAKRAIKPSVVRLSQSHLKTVIHSTSTGNLSKHALAYKDDLDCLNELLWGFFDSTRQRVNVIDHFLLFQYFVLYKSLSGKTYPSDNFRQMIADFQPPYKDHQGNLERQADLIHQCEELVGDNAERFAVFVKFRNSCEEIRWQYRYRCLYPMLWARLSGAIIQSVSKAFPSVKREQSSRTSLEHFVAQGIKGKSVELRGGATIVNITSAELATAEKRAAASAMREKLQRKRARGVSKTTVPQFIDPEEIKRREANARALLAEETTTNRGRGRGGRSKSRGQDRKVQAIRTTVSKVSSSMSSSSSSVGPSPSASSSSSFAGVQSPMVVYEQSSREITKLIRQFENNLEISQSQVSPIQRAMKSSITQVIDASIELGDLAKVQDAAALAEHINTLLFAVSLASEQGLYANLLHRKGAETPLQALYYARHSQRWLLNEWGSSTPSDEERAGEVDRLEFYIRSLYSASASEHSPTALGLLQRAEAVRQGKLSHDQARELIGDVYALVQNQLNWSLDLLGKCSGIRPPVIDWRGFDGLARNIIHPNIHLVVREVSNRTIYETLRLKVSDAIWERPGECLQRSHETFYADAERNLAFVLSRQRRESSLHNYVKQTLRAKAQFLLSLGIAKYCERDPGVSLIPLSELSHDMWEYITQVGIDEGALKDEEADEIYLTSKANSCVRYHPLFKSSTGTAADMVREAGRLDSARFSGALGDDGFRIVGPDQRKAERLQKECSNQLNACLSVASRLLSL